MTSLSLSPAVPLSSFAPPARHPTKLPPGTKGRHRLLEHLALVGEPLLERRRLFGGGPLSRQCRRDPSPRLLGLARRPYVPRDERGATRPARRVPASGSACHSRTTCTRTYNARTYTARARGPSACRRPAPELDLSRYQLKDAYDIRGTDAAGGSRAEHARTRWHPLTRDAGSTSRFACGIAHRDRRHAGRGERPGGHRGHPQAPAHRLLRRGGHRVFQPAGAPAVAGGPRQGASSSRHPRSRTMATAARRRRGVGVCDSGGHRTRTSAAGWRAMSRAARQPRR